MSVSLSGSLLCERIWDHPEETESDIEFLLNEESRDMSEGLLSFQVKGPQLQQGDAPHTAQPAMGRARPLDSQQCPAGMKPSVGAPAMPLSGLICVGASSFSVNRIHWDGTGCTEPATGPCLGRKRQHLALPCVEAGV